MEGKAGEKKLVKKIGPVTVDELMIFELDKTQPVASQRWKIVGALDPSEVITDLPQAM